MAGGEKRRRYGGPKAKIGAYKPGVVPKLPKLPGKEYEVRPAAAGIGGTIYTSKEGEAAGPKREEVPGNVIYDMPTYFRLGSDRYYAHSRKNNETGRWEFQFWRVDERGGSLPDNEIPGWDRLYRSDAEQGEEYGDPIDALEAARKRAAFRRREHADEE